MHSAALVAQPVGLLGGSFDPVHNGHLRLAEEMADALGLESVRFIPAGQPPHREPPRASAGARADMVRLAIAGNPRFRLDEYEILKPGPSYMVETLQALREELGYVRPLILILGLDAFAGLTGWHQWPRILELAHLAVAHRPGHAGLGWERKLAPELQQTLLRHQAGLIKDLRYAPAGCIWLHAITQLDISATRLREALHRGESPRYLMPEAVIDYIRSHHLYT
jgi:nicotinate-nucleotide adenylyltransferase